MSKNLTVRVLVAIALGILLGILWPEAAVQLKFLSDIFVRLVKMVIPPIVFLTIVVGMANMGNLKQVGVLGAKTLLYFEIVTTLALVIGVAVVSLLGPGVGFDVARVRGVDASLYASTAPAASDWRVFLLNIVPDSVVGALAKGDMLPVLLFSVLFGAATARHRDAAVLATPLQRLGEVFFGVIEIVMKLSPLAALGAMAYAVGQFGLGSLLALGKLMLSVYVTMALFVFGVLGSIARAYGFSLWRLLRHIREELVLVLGTSSSESVLPSVMRKLEAAGCDKAVVGLVIPAGYSFNLDGTSIYLSMATVFIAQAYGVTLSWNQLLMTLGILMLTSKGAAGVTGSGFVTLAATLAALPDHAVPAEGVALVVGVDRFMSEARAITNLIGNSVAAVVMAKTQRQFDDRGVV
jgi:aerobic C4-dicarboxylate transport protein